MGTGPWGFPTPEDPAPDPMTQPLPVAAPPTWKGREDRVRWCRENLTPGEQALLVKLARQADRIRTYDYDAIIAAERKALA